MSSHKNLEEAQKIRSSGYKTKVHALPAFKQWFDVAYRDGGKTTQELRREAISLFPAQSTQIPSVQSLNQYVKRYLSETVVVAPYTPQYHEHVRTFDAYLKLLAAAKETHYRYEQAKKREAVVSSRKSMSLDWAKLYAQHLNDLIDIEIRLGIRRGMVVPANVQQVNISNSQTTNNFSVSEKRPAEGVFTKEQVDQAYREVKEYAETNNISLVRRLHPVEKLL